MQPKSWKNRATRCPVCGGKACHWSERLYKLKRNCLCCGYGCCTPRWVRNAVILVTVLCAVLGCQIDVAEILDETYHGRYSWTAFLGILGYFLSSSILLWLVPLKPCPEKGRAFPGMARVTRVLDYSMEDVYTALSNALRRSDTYKVLQQDIERHSIYVYRDKGWCNRRRCDSPSVSIALLLEERPDGRCGAVISVEYSNRRPIPESEKARELEELCQLAERELELFHYRKIIL